MLTHTLTPLLCSLLLQLTFPRAKLLLMSSNQEDLNGWYQSLSSAIRYVHTHLRISTQCEVLTFQLDVL